MKGKKLSVLIITVLAIACSTTRYVSARPDLEPAFKMLTYSEIVGVMAREPDAVMDNEQGGRTLVYMDPTKDEYLKEFFQDNRVKDGSKMYIHLLLDENDVCYALETNIVRKSIQYDIERTERNVINTAGHVMKDYISNN